MLSIPAGMYLLKVNNIVLMQIRILGKSEKMDSEEDIVIAIFMNSFNAVHTFTALKMEIVLMMRTYYNNNQNMNQEMYFIICPKKKIIF